MKVLLKNVSRSLFTLLMLLCLLMAPGCDSGSVGDQKAPMASDSGQAESQANEEEQKQADAEVSAFSSDKNQKVNSEDLTVQFLNVGQGSATLIRQNGHTMLVDGGDRETSSYVVSLLKEQGITSLDYVVVSHYDSDHLAGIIGVLNAFVCDAVLAPDYAADSKIYESFLSVIEEKKIPVAYPKLGDDYAFAESSFRVVSPASYQYGDANSNSLGIRLAYGENSFLLCGDCTEESEQDILYLGTELDSDVYMANHHGSKYSNSPEFLEAVSPEYVVISCGAGNSYGHPDATVMLEIQKLGAGLFRTDLQGMITIISDGSSLSFEQEVCMDYRSGTEIAEAGILDENIQGNEKIQENENSETARYVLNTSTMKFHLPECSSVKDMKEENKEYANEARDTIITQGYAPCKRCNP